MKILEKEKINDQKDVERITREIKILKKVRHPNVIQLYEVSVICLFKQFQLVFPSLIDGKFKSPFLFLTTIPVQDIITVTVFLFV